MKFTDEKDGAKKKKQKMRKLNTANNSGRTPHTKNGKAKQNATTKNKIQGWIFHNSAIKRISHKVIPNIPTTNGKNSTFPVCISTDVF